MKKTVLFLALFLISGCVNFTSNNTKNIENGALVPYSKDSVQTKIYLYPTINGVADPEKEIDLRMSFNEALKYSFDKTNLFGEVSQSVMNPDITIEMVVKNHYTECGNCNYLTYGTLFIVPSWTHDKYHYQVRITKHKTGRTASFYYYEDALEVKQLFLALAMPFAYSTKDNMHSRVFDKIAFEASKM